MNTSLLHWLPVVALPLLVAGCNAHTSNDQGANPTTAGLTATRFAGCTQFFYQEKTPAIPEALASTGVRELYFADFAVLHSASTKSPVFTAEKLSAASLADASDEKRTDRFYEEARLPSAERARLADYKGSGYDRGHMAAAAQRTTPEAMAQSFSLANMVPQNRDNNRGVWAKAVELATRKYVQRAKGRSLSLRGRITILHSRHAMRAAYVFLMRYISWSTTLRPINHGRTGHRIPT